MKTADVKLSVINLLIQDIMSSFWPLNRLWISHCYILYTPSFKNISYEPRHEISNN